jgi:hypothetical protein
MQWIFFAYLWSFRWPNYIVTLPRYFSFRLPHLNIPTGPPSDLLDKNSQRTWFIKNFSKWKVPVAWAHSCQGQIQRGAHPAPPPPLLKLEKIRFFGVKSWIFTRYTPKFSRLPPLGAIILQYNKLYLNYRD